jgi:hypothetical protein
MPGGAPRVSSGFRRAVRGGAFRFGWDVPDQNSRAKYEGQREPERSEQMVIREEWLADESLDAGTTHRSHWSRAAKLGGPISKSFDEAWQAEEIDAEDGMLGALKHRSGPRPVSLTRHARARSARRNVTLDVVDYALAHGRMIQRTGITFYFLGRRDMPPADLCGTGASRLEGIIVLVGPDGAVITVYRNRRGLHMIQRKMKYRLADCERGWNVQQDQSASEREIA